VELDPELLGDAPGVFDIFHPRAVPDDVVLVDPVFHVRAHDVAPLLLEQERGDGAVDSAGHRDEDLGTRGHGSTERRVLACRLSTARRAGRFTPRAARIC
jgi:hypothetical protein